MKLTLHEIFFSIQGEGSRAGRPCVFVRLSGCPLRCRYCDTTHAFHEGYEVDLAGILDDVRHWLGVARLGPSAPFIEVTGGEPLAQEGTPELLQALLDFRCEVALETAGSHDLESVPRQIIKIVDRKTPGSGEVERWKEKNLELMVPGQDELKLVLADKRDYLWARTWCETRRVWDRFEILFVPAWGLLDPKWLAEQILRDRLPVRFQLQLHKLVWGPDALGV